MENLNNLLILKMDINPYYEEKIQKMTKLMERINQENEDIINENEAMEKELEDLRKEIELNYDNMKALINPLKN